MGDARISVKLVCSAQSGITKHVSFSSLVMFKQVQSLILQSQGKILTLDWCVSIITEF